MLPDALHSFPFEQLGVILQLHLDAIRFIVDFHGEVHFGDAGIHIFDIDLDIRQLQRASLVVLNDQHHIEQRAPALAKIHIQIFEDLTEGIALILKGVEGEAANLRQKRRQCFIIRGGAPQGQCLHEQPDGIVQFAVMTPGDSGPQNHIIGAAIV